MRGTLTGRTDWREGVDGAVNVPMLDGAGICFGVGDSVNEGGEDWLAAADVSIVVRHCARALSLSADESRFSVAALVRCSMGVPAAARADDSFSTF